MNAMPEMTTEEKEAAALRLLEEVMLEKHGRCDALLVRGVIDGVVVEVFDTETTSSSHPDAAACAPSASAE